MGVWLTAEFSRGAREKLGPRRDLSMDFHPDDDFPVAGRAFDEFRRFVVNVHAAAQVDDHSLTMTTNRVKNTAARRLSAALPRSSLTATDDEQPRREHRRT